MGDRYDAMERYQDWVAGAKTDRLQQELVELTGPHLEDSATSRSLRLRRRQAVLAELHTRAGQQDDFMAWAGAQTVQVLRDNLAAALAIVDDPSERHDVVREAMRRRALLLEAELEKRSFTIAEMRERWQAELERSVRASGGLTMTQVSEMVDAGLEHSSYRAADLEWKDGVITARLVPREEEHVVTLQVPLVAMTAGSLLMSLSGTGVDESVVARTPHGSYTFEVVDVTRETEPVQHTTSRTVLHLREVESERRASIADDVIAAAEES